MIKKAVCCFALAMYSIPIFAAQTDTNRTVTKLAVEIADKGYFKVAEGLTSSCQYGVVFFGLTSASGKGHLSVLLAAKASNQKIEITYEIDAGNTCSLSTVAIE